MTDSKKIIELYDIMEGRLEELEISFDEFSVLYKTFKQRTSVIDVKEETKKEEKPKAIPPNPFPFISHAGAGWTTK